MLRALLPSENTVRRCFRSLLLPIAGLCFLGAVAISVMTLVTVHGSADETAKEMEIEHPVDGFFRSPEEAIAPTLPAATTVLTAKGEVNIPTPDPSISVSPMTWSHDAPTSD